MTEEYNYNALLTRHVYGITSLYTHTRYMLTKTKSKARDAAESWLYHNS